MTAVIYARYSSDNQREESIEGQIRECTAYAEKNGITVVKHYIDRALSAKTDNRPEFQQMIKDSEKRLFDIVVSLIAIVIVSATILIPIIIAIKLSSKGPILFKQKRTGYRGREFVCLKFRTMKVNADADTRQATKDDPRKTKVGDFLRKTSLDELPQFLNVLYGNMSVVGPRPHMVKQTDEYRKLINRYMVRHTIKPGITGLAQVSGFRGQTEKLWQMEKRVEYDVKYIENWTFWLDIKIMVRTVLNAVQGEKNAY